MKCPVSGDSIIVAPHYLFLWCTVTKCLVWLTSGLGGLYINLSVHVKRWAGGFLAHKLTHGEPQARS